MRPKVRPRPPLSKMQSRRLTRELNEALDQQAATSEVLGVISAFSGELQRVFQSMLENALRLCDAKFGVVFRFDGDACPLRKSARRQHLPNTESGAARLNRSKAVTSIALREQRRRATPLTTPPKVLRPRQSS